ncbi:MAG TPA: dephospho-CoA kinase [Ilumatobacteraceae bacterium]|nr:dephospho-CoA kinase [Ilumatobacteraceae bacterium]
MILVGLTGGIGSGKSTVSSLLAEHGAVIIDADALVRELQAPGSPVLEQMAERFGRGIIRDDGSLDRAAVAEIVFNDETALKALNDIVHPALAVEVTRRIDAARGTDDVVVLDFPLLAERPREGLSAAVVVDAPVETAIERLVASRGMKEDDARARIANQVSREQRLAIATHVIDNSGDLDSLRGQVDALWDELGRLPHDPGEPTSQD